MPFFCFLAWPPVAQIMVVATFLLSVWQENNFVNKMLTFCALLVSAMYCVGMRMKWCGIIYLFFSCGHSHNTARINYRLWYLRRKQSWIWQFVCQHLILILKTCLFSEFYICSCSLKIVRFVFLVLFFFGEERDIRFCHEKRVSMI